jgi:subtilisin family serine protease
VKVISVLKREESPAGPPRWSAVQATLTNALRYAQRTQPAPTRVINWSWEGVGHDQLVEDRLKAGDQLVTIAAGNRTLPLDAQPARYPARYSQINNSLALTVGALRPGGTWAKFSNWGPNTVSIAAPGCAIPALDAQGEPVLAMGTSFASPIVAFTAATIESLGVTDMRQVRDRILSTADRDTTLEGKVHRGLVLNVPRAIALYDDIVVLEGEPPLFGRLRSGGGAVDFVKLAGGDAQSKVRRVDIEDRGPGQPLRLVIERQDRNDPIRAQTVDCSQCRLLHLTPADGGEERPIPLSKVRLVIPARFRRAGQN